MGNASLQLEALRMHKPRLQPSALANSLQQSAKVRILRLLNPHNLCYANSLSMAWLWLSGLDPGDPRNQFGSTLLDAPTCRISLLQMMTWQPIWRGWPRPHLQQEAQEFFAHMQSTQAAPYFEGAWEVRLTLQSLHDRSYEVVDSGITSQGLPIPLPTHPDTLENCIKSWCLQPHKHAFTAPPRWLCLHLLRFTHDAGTIRKSNVPIGFQAGES